MQTVYTLCPPPSQHYSPVNKPEPQRRNFASSRVRERETSLHGKLPRLNISRLAQFQDSDEKQPEERLFHTLLRTHGSTMTIKPKSCPKVKTWGDEGRIIINEILESTTIFPSEAWYTLKDLQICVWYMLEVYENVNSSFKFLRNRGMPKPEWGLESGIETFSKMQGQCEVAWAKFRTCVLQDQAIAMKCDRANTAYQFLVPWSIWDLCKALGNTLTWSDHSLSCLEELSKLEHVNVL